MITVKGYLQKEYGGRFAIVKWSNGILSGDEQVVDGMKALAQNNLGRTLFVDVNVYDWLSSPITFGGLVAMMFNPEMLSIEGMEQMAPPPCPDNAVC